MYFIQDREYNTVNVKIMLIGCLLDAHIRDRCDSVSVQPATHIALVLPLTISLHFTDALQDQTGDDVRYIQKQNSNLRDEFSALSGDVSEMAWGAIQ